MEKCVLGDTPCESGDIFLWVYPIYFFIYSVKRVLTSLSLLVSDVQCLSILCKEKLWYLLKLEYKMSRLTGVACARGVIKVLLQYHAMLLFFLLIWEENSSYDKLFS